MFTVTEVVVIARSRADVFAYLTDAGRRPEWDDTVISEALTSPPPVGVGSTINSRMRVMGREVEFDWRVTEYVPPGRMAIASTRGTFPTSLLFDLADHAAGTRVSATIDGEPSGMLRLVEPMIEDTIRSTLATGLGRVVRILEA
ncbi:polyketide cyclase/dehydrase/lipid transport protein [Microbacterium sp. SLBN-154]|uniref:SRPBCC family protein n=1 Tax=Microbacterium sp. SLBN-154 TaxID=2768458 RepID=UPI0011520991|nr:SRPBCC family protein [Microbacterium sp. SLBN-154]TQK20156.1 polyketide cyclase/dehydrase/lipid transport protein [Microbacterium sp. SLBN-154]